MKRILLIVCIIISAISCKEHRNPIPIMPVYLNLDLTFKDKELKAIPSYKEYTRSNINSQIGERAGFGGVLVIHTMLGEYKAFDLTCPYEINQNITVKVDDEVLYAVCPKCGTKYEIGFGTGAPDGASKHGLLEYHKITLTGSNLRVSN